MKKLLLIALLIVGCEEPTGTDDGNGNNNVTELEGNWIGHDEGNPSGTWTFDISGSEMDMDGPGEWYKGIFSINTQPNPKQLDYILTDCFISDGIGLTSLAIYKIEDNTMTFVGNEPGSTTRPTSFTGGRVLIVTKQ